MSRHFISFAALLILPLVTTCPPSKQIHPCTCSDQTIFCSGLENDQVLSDVVYALKTWMKKLYSFTIKNSNFMYIPHDIFSNVEFQEFQIVESSFMALTDTDVAFEGLEDSLTQLVITDSDMLNSWDWMALKNLKKLLKIQIDVDLEIVSEEITRLTSVNLMDISLNKNQINYIHDLAFANFKQLLSVSLRNNLITEIKRSMFPNPATLLEKLDLGYVATLYSFSISIWDFHITLKLFVIYITKIHFSFYSTNISVIGTPCYTKNSIRLVIREISLLGYLCIWHHRRGVEFVKS